MVLLLLEHIVQLFLCLVLGWVLIRVGLLKPTDSRVLSVVCLYLVIPCIIVGAFQIDSTPELLQGLALSLGTAIGIHVLFFVFTALLRRPLHCLLYTSRIHVVKTLDEALELSRRLNGGRDLRATLLPHGANTLPKFQS